MCVYRYESVRMCTYCVHRCAGVCLYHVYCIVVSNHVYCIQCKTCRSWCKYSVDVDVGGGGDGGRYGGRDGGGGVCVRVYYDACLSVRVYAYVHICTHGYGPTYVCKRVSTRMRIRSTDRQRCSKFWVLLAVHLQTSLRTLRDKNLYTTTNKC